MKYGRRGLLLLGWLLSYGMSWGQDQAIFLSDLAFVFGAGEARIYLREEMQAFSDQHHVRLAFTLLPESSPSYEIDARLDESDLLQQASPCLAITTWHGQNKYYRRHQVQINEALAHRLPPATAEQIVNEWLTYYDDLPPQSGMQMGLELVLIKLGDYLKALPPPEVVPTITFANGPATGSQPPLGLDAFTYEVFRSHYDQETVNEESYPVAWKALLSGQATSVLAQVNEGVSFPPGLVFKQNGNAIATQPATENHQQQLTLAGQMNEQEGSVEVYASSEENAELVGKLRTISYDALPQKLVLVVLDNVMDDAPYLARLSREVPAIFAQAGVTLTVESQEFDTEWGDRDVPLEDETTGLLSNYPDQLKRVIKDYRKEHEEEKETAYIFLAGGSSTGKLGYMPKKRAYGFVYLHEHDHGEPVAKTIAHELGHGLFRLEHTFEAYPALTKGSTNNLMDYGRGTRLHKYQWDLVHNPEAMLGWFQDEEESAMVGIQSDTTNVMALLDAIKTANEEGEDELETTAFIKNKVYTYKGKVTIQAEKVDLLIEHWYYSGRHHISPDQEYSYEHSVQKNKTIYQFDGYVTNDKIKPLLRIYVDNDKAEILKDYLFVHGKPLDDCTYRAYSFGNWKPNSAKYGCTRTNASYDCNEDGVFGDRHHHGVDLLAAIGTSVYAMAEGTVTHVGEVSGYGESIGISGRLEDKSGNEHSVIVFYAHLSSIDVLLNQKVKAGDKIGETGITGASFLQSYPDEHHLHLEIITNWWPSGFGERMSPDNFFDIENPTQ